MVVLSKTNEVLKFSADENYLNAQGEIYPTISCGINWIPKDDDSQTLIFNHHISFKDQRKKLLELKCRLSVNARLNTVDEAAAQVLRAVKSHIDYIAQYLKDNLAVAYSKVHLTHCYEDDAGIQQIKLSLIDAMNATPSSQLSDTERHHRGVVNEVMLKMAYKYKVTIVGKVIS